MARKMKTPESSVEMVPIVRGDDAFRRLLWFYETDAGAMIRALHRAVDQDDAYLPQVL